ncbi:hypothetical protein C8Q70DRAFT_978753 [Cubamyces menziesii]|nr:hypothetical protein C8Q70DRAFT_978753 [Cubamyces menziesii]
MESSEYGCDTRIRFLIVLIVARPAAGTKTTASHHRHMFTQFIPFEPQLRQPIFDRTLRESKKKAAFYEHSHNSGTEELTGIEGAHMRYTIDGYASRIVCQYGLKLVDWPPEIPFENLSNLIGGIGVLSTLQDAWNSGTLRFERVTPEDIENATRDPESVHPNPSLLHWRNGAESAAAGHPHRPAAPILMPLVLHPGNLSILGRHPTAIHPGTILSRTRTTALLVDPGVG